MKQTNKLKRLPFLVASHSARSSASCDSTSSPPATHPKEESFFNSKLYYSAPFSAVALFRAFPRCISLCFEPPRPPKGNFLLFHSFAHLTEDHFLLKFISNLLQRSSSRNLEPQRDLWRAPVSKRALRGRTAVMSSLLKKPL